jgi:hypothetical protein
MSAAEMTLLEEAQSIINGARQEAYGTPLESFTWIGKLWSALLGIEVSPEIVALCLIQLKVSRAVNTPGHRDSWLDIAGYAGCWELIQKGREE